jgi:uncharacterized protein
VIIALFGIYSLLGRTPFVLHRDSRLWLFVCRFAAGVLGGAYGMNGPPLVIYGAMRRWSAPHFRATLQGYFLPASLIGMIGYWLAGLWVPAVTHYYLISLPLALAAVFLGRALNHRLQGDAFLKYIYVALAAIGLSRRGRRPRLPMRAKFAVLRNAAGSVYVCDPHTRPTQEP